MYFLTFWKQLTRYLTRKYFALVQKTMNLNSDLRQLPHTNEESESNDFLVGNNGSPLKSVQDTREVNWALN